MKIKDWIQSESLTSLQVTATVENQTVQIYSNDTVKGYIGTRYNNYTLLYDTITDNNNMWNSYIAYVQHNIDKYYDMLYNKDLLTDGETSTVTETYDITDSANSETGKTITHTGTDNVAISDSSSTGTSGTDTSQVYAYNSSDWENSEKDAKSETITYTDTASNNRTKNLTDSETGTDESLKSKTGTKTTVSEKSYENNIDVTKVIELYDKYKLLDIIVNGFINIAAYIDTYEGGLFD